MYCTALYACKSAVLTNHNNIYASGGHSAKYSAITFVTNVFGFGYLSLCESNITQVKQTLYCLALEACLEAKVSNYNVIYANGYHALASATIINGMSGIFAYGESVLANATIDNVGSGNLMRLYCIGTEVCSGADIRGVWKIVAMGKNVLRHAVIVSSISCNNNDASSEESNEFSIEISGAMDGNYYLYCNESDSCNIECLSSDACGNLKIYCEGSCTVSCDERDGISCPQGNWNKTTIPETTGNDDVWLTTELYNIHPTQEPSKSFISTTGGTTPTPTSISTAAQTTAQTAKVQTTAPTLVETIIATSTTPVKTSAETTVGTNVNSVLINTTHKEGVRTTYEATNSKNVSLPTEMTTDAEATMIRIKSTVAETVEESMFLF